MLGAVLGACGRVRLLPFSSQTHVPALPNHCGDRGWPEAPAALTLVNGMCEKIQGMEGVDTGFPNLSGLILHGSVPVVASSISPCYCWGQGW